MLFTSFEFILLLLATISLYYLPVLRKIQVQILIAASLIFYARNSLPLLLLLLTSAFINIVCSYVIAKSDQKKTIALLGVAANLFILLFFKYSPLIGKTFFDVSNGIGAFLISIPLPIGISFFTFQGLSLVIDVYRGSYYENNKKLPLSTADVVAPTFLGHAKNILFFKAFFPQLIAGPIVKAHDFIPQIKLKTISDIDWELCFKNLIIGYFLKMFVADNLNMFTFWIQYPYYESISSGTLLALLFGYSIQIFADFAGYSLIAIGLAGLFGYKLRDNFIFPYISSSIAEFWKRWHISLSSFLMEYLYFPLGGNKKGKVRTYLNLLITMILGGLWHGAAWSYAVWGTYHGMLLALERFIFGKKLLHLKNGKRVISTVLVFILVSFGWLLFKLPNFTDVIGFFKSVSVNWGMKNNNIYFKYVLLFTLPVLLYHAHYLLSGKEWYQKIVIPVNWIVYAVMLFLIIMNSGVSGSFIYFQF